MNKPKRFAFAAAGLLMAGQAYAETYTFTGPGWNDGQSLISHDGWEQLNPGNTPATRNIVNTAAPGTLKMTTADSWAEAIQTDTPIMLDEAGDAVMIQFKFNYTATAYTTLESSPLSAQISAENGPYNNNFRLSLRRLPEGNVKFFYVDGEGTPMHGPVAAESLLGINGSGMTDDLALTIILGRNQATGTEDWSLDATLQNLTTGSNVLTIAIDNYVARPHIAADSLVAGINGSWQRPGNNNLSDISVEEITIVETNLVAVAPPLGVENVVIGEATGNGDFEANTAGGEHTYAETPNWHNAWAENDDTTIFTYTNSTPSRVGMTFQQRRTVNDTGWTVNGPGEKIAVSYDFFRFGTYTDDEIQNVFLFTTDGVPVDGDMPFNAMNILSGSEASYTVVAGWLAAVDHGVIYTTTEADVGKTLYLGFRFDNPDLSAGCFPRIDNVEMIAYEPPPTTTIIGGSIGNGDFEANNIGSTHTYAQTPNWYNAWGDESANFTFTNATPSRSAMTWQQRRNVNDSGWTVQSADEKFSISYEFIRYGSYNGDETNAVYLFTTDGVQVDGDLEFSDMIAVDGSEVTHADNGAWIQPVTHEYFYTTTTNDIGKTFYLCTRFDNPDLVSGPQPRIDNVSLIVQSVGSGRYTFADFVADYELGTEDRQADNDADNLSNWGEYVFGGNPTNANDIGTQPYFDAVLGVYHYALIGDSSVRAHVVTTTDLVYPNWTTNKTEEVSVNDGVLSPYSVSIGTIEGEQFIKLLVE